MEIRNYTNTAFGTKISKDLQNKIITDAFKIREKTLPDDVFKKIFILENATGENSELVFREFDGIKYFFLDTKLGSRSFSTKVSKSKKINIVSKFLSISPKDLLDAEINNIKHIMRKSKGNEYAN